MALDNRLDESQTRAGAPLGIVLLVQPLEDAEDLPVKFAGDANAVVADMEDEFRLRVLFGTARSIEADLDALALGFVVFDSVGYQVPEHFGDARQIADDGRQRLVDDDLGVALLEGRLQRRLDVLDHRVEIGWLDRELLTSKARVIEQIVDQTFEALTEKHHAVQALQAGRVQSVL